MADRDPGTGQFLPGNKFWTQRSSSGPAPTFADGDALWAACLEYFDWTYDNPLAEAKIASDSGKPVVVPLAKMRAMTINGLCIFLDISSECWRGWKTEGHAKHRPDLAAVIAKAEAVIYQQKFEGAAADLLNPSIIARELGLPEKKEVTGAGGGPMEVRGIADFYADLASEPEPGAS